MKTFLAFVLLLLTTLAGGAAAVDEIITASITVTNPPLGNTNTLTVNGSVRTFTNSITASPSTLIQETNSVYYTATNILNHLSLNPQSTGHLIEQTTASNVTVRGVAGEALTVSLAGLWGTISYSTTGSTNAWVVRVPMSVEPPDLRTNVGSALVEYLNLATNSLNTNATALGNFLTKGASPRQTITGPVTFNSLSGTNAGLTNGIYANGVLVNPISTNQVNYGNAIRSEGSGGNSLQVGSNAVASGPLSMAIGNGSLASSNSSLAIGINAISTNAASIAFGVDARTLGEQAVAIGNSSLASTNSIAIGFGASDSGAGGVTVGQDASNTGLQGMALGNNAGNTGNSGLALGHLAAVTHNRSVAIGADAASSATNQITLGTTTERVTIPGLLEVSGSQSNTTFTGTNTLNGDLSLGRYQNSTIVNGNNAGILIGTNVMVELSGGTTIAQYAGFTASRDGDLRFVRMSGAVTNIIVNEVDSTWSTDGTSSRRIVTGTGASLALTNSPSWLQMTYRGSGASGRWEVMSHSR